MRIIGGDPAVDNVDDGDLLLLKFVLLKASTPSPTSPVILSRSSRRSHTPISILLGTSSLLDGCAGMAASIAQRCM